MESNGGARVLTDRRMAVYASWFAAQARRCPETETLNLSREGVRIAGLEPSEPEDLLDLKDVRDVVGQIMADLEAGIANRQATAAEWNPLQGALEGLAAELQTIERLADEAVTLVGRGRPGRPDAHVLERLNRIDRQVMGNTSRQMVGFLMQPLIQRITEGDEDASDPIQRTKEIYQEILRSARHHLPLVQDAALRVRRRTTSQTTGTDQSYSWALRS